MRVLASPAVSRPDGNPYIDLLYSQVSAHGIHIEHLNRRRLAGRYDIVHVHWPEHLVDWRSRRRASVTSSVMLFGLSALRHRGARLVYTAHDLGPHDNPWPDINHWYMTRFTNMVDGVITLGAAAVPEICEAYPALEGKPFMLARHGHYRGAYGTVPRREDARRRLRLPDGGPILLLLGLIRRYKRVPELIRSFIATVEGHAHLVVAGKVAGDQELADEVRAAAAESPSVTVRLGLVATADIALWHGAADVVVLPYQQATSLHSGAAIMALSMNRPVVVPTSPTMAELRSIVGPRWVYTFPGDVHEAVRVGIDASAAHGRPPEPDLRALEWEPIGRATVTAYESFRR